MAKITWKPGTMIYPIPAVIVTCGTIPELFNCITVAWTGIVCTNPAMCYISLRPERHSYEIIKKDMVYAINLTTSKLAYATDWCGVKSGRDYNKFKECNLSYSISEDTGLPLLDDSPLILECKVKSIQHLGSHDMFLSEIIVVHADDKYIDPKTDAFDMIKSSPLAYCHGKYYELGEYKGKFGFSVEKKK